MVTSPRAGKSVDNLPSPASGPRSEYPFYSRNSYQKTRRRSSAASSIQSFGGAHDATPDRWSSAVFESGQNAISTLLQPPIIRTGVQATSAYKPPTAKDIPPVTLTNIPHVDTNDFKSYITQVGPLFNQLRRIQEHEAASGEVRKTNGQDGARDSTNDGHLRPSISPITPRKGSSASLNSLTSLDLPTPTRRSSSSFNRKNTQAVPPLATIPNVYFNDDFRLENPRTFDVVSERSEVIRPSAQIEGGDKEDEDAAMQPRKALATNAILQEKLSWYLDTIEVNLINSISTASTTFFTALGSLKELHSEAAESVQRIKFLRRHLQALDEEVANNGLRIVQKKRRQANLQQLSETVLQLKRIVEGVADCEIMVDAGETEKALNKIDALERLIAGESTELEGNPGPKDLRGTAALRSVRADLSTLRFRIGKAYEADFTNILLDDLRRHVESVSSADVMQRWSNAASRAKGGHTRTNSVFPSYLVATEELKSQLLPHMTGLFHAKHIATAASAYRAAVLREIRNIIRRPLPSSSDDDNESMLSVSTAGGNRHLSTQEKSTILARNLRALDAGDGEDLLKKIYIGITESLRRFTTQVKVLLDVASSLSSGSSVNGSKSPMVKSPIASPRPERGSPSPMPHEFELQEELHKTLDVTNLLGQAVDVANEKVVKVLKVRSEQATHLTVDLFLRYFTLNLYFTNECESISGRSGTSLKNVVNSHIKEFVARHRDVEMQKLAQGMESDQWNPRDFSEENTKLLGEVLECSTHDAPAWTEKTKLWIPCPDLTTQGNEPATLEVNGASKEKIRTAVIDSEKFTLPNSAILCLYGSASFLQLIAGIPSMTTDIGGSLMSYLQLFNSRCTQLILGAGATKSAGLKNITAKHLALASQGLSFITTLIPHMRESVRRHAGTSVSISTLMSEFDKVKRLLQEHQGNINQKLVEIMSGRAAIHAKSLAAIAWSEPDANNNESSPYIETLTKETTTLHRALTKYLPETTSHMIMVPVFNSYKEQLGEAFQGADPVNEAGKRRMLRDVEHFTARLHKIDGFGETGNYLSNIVTTKEVPGDDADAEVTVTDTPEANAAEAEAGAGEEPPPAEAATTVTPSAEDGDPDHANE